MIHKVLTFIKEFQSYHSRNQNVVFQDVSHILAPTTAAGGDFGEPSGKNIQRFSMHAIIKLSFSTSYLLVQGAHWFLSYSTTLPTVPLQIVKLMPVGLPAWVKGLRLEPWKWADTFLLKYLLRLSNLRHFFLIIPGSGWRLFSRYQF